MMRSDREYLIAYVASHVSCASTKAQSVEELVEDLWPQLQGPLYVRLEVFRIAAHEVLQERREREISQVLSNEECASLLSSACTSSAG